MPTINAEAMGKHLEEISTQVARRRSRHRAV
jgi:hypothetical protein